MQTWQCCFESLQWRSDAKLAFIWCWLFLVTLASEVLIVMTYFMLRRSRMYRHAVLYFESCISLYDSWKWKGFEPCRFMIIAQTGQDPIYHWQLSCRYHLAKLEHEWYHNKSLVSARDAHWSLMCFESLTEHATKMMCWMQLFTNGDWQTRTSGQNVEEGSILNLAGLW